MNPTNDGCCCKCGTLLGEGDRMCPYCCFIHETAAPSDATVRRSRCCNAAVFDDKGRAHCEQCRLSCRVKETA